MDTKQILKIVRDRLGNLPSYNPVEFLEMCVKVRDEIEATEADQPSFCYGRLSTGEVIVIRQNEKGFFRTDYDVQSKEWVRDMNLKLGVDEATADAMGLCSISGNWKAFDDICADLNQAKESTWK